MVLMACTPMRCACRVFGMLRDCLALPEMPDGVPSAATLRLWLLRLGASRTDSGQATGRGLGVDDRPHQSGRSGKLLGYSGDSTVRLAATGPISARRLDFTGARPGPDPSISDIDWRIV